MNVALYAKQNLPIEIKSIKNSNRKNECPELTIYEKAVIYKYSNDGFAAINEELRTSRGRTFSEFAGHLNDALSKLPDFEGLVYRMVYLTREEIARYRAALKNNKPLREYPFTSTTKSRLIATRFAGTTSHKPNCLFRIHVSTGKEIDKIAKFDEKEVLLIPNTRFRVLEVRKEALYTLITMEEI